jgi:hypothetical protein
VKSIEYVAQEHKYEFRTIDRDPPKNSWSACKLEAQSSYKVKVKDSDGNPKKKTKYLLKEKTNYKGFQKKDSRISQLAILAEQGNLETAEVIPNKYEGSKDALSRGGELLHDMLNPNFVATVSYNRFERDTKAGCSIRTIKCEKTLNVNRWQGRKEVDSVCRPWGHNLISIEENNIKLEELKKLRGKGSATYC